MAGSKLTRNGVCYNLSETPFHAEVDGYDFAFSSRVHLESFVKKAKVKKDWLNDSLSRRFHVKVKSEELALVQLYHQVETRGFRVVSPSGTVYYEPESMTFWVTL